jgi:DNA invertase Pin-like site-specific DNA recombinase
MDDHILLNLLSTVPGTIAGLWKAITRREIDMMAAWSLDRLGRSLQDLVGFLSELRASRCELYLHQQGLNTSTPAGRALFGMFSVFADFERAMIIERTKAGLARARAQGNADRRGRCTGFPGARDGDLQCGKGPWVRRWVRAED